MKTKQINQHEKEYIHIPKPTENVFRKLIGIFTCLGLSVLNFLIIKTIWITNNLGDAFKPKEELINNALEFTDLIVLYPIVAQYILISLIIILFVSLFKELNSYNEAGLISGLTAGLTLGFSLGLIYGLFVGLIYGLIVLFELIVGLIIFLFVGLIFGLINEFD